MIKLNLIVEKTGSTKLDINALSKNHNIEKTELFRNYHDKFKCKMASGCQRCFHFLNLRMNELLFVVVAH